MHSGTDWCWRGEFAKVPSLWKGEIKRSAMEVVRCLTRREPGRGRDGQLVNEGEPGRDDKQSKWMPFWERAIQNEEEAYRFYVQLHELVDDPEAKDTLQFLAEEGEGTQAYLMATGREASTNSWRMRAGSRLQGGRTHGATGNPQGMTTRDVYLVAAAKELAAHNLYQELAARIPVEP